MPPSMLDAYKRRKNVSSTKNIRNHCEDCLFFNPFGKFCELYNHQRSVCDAYEDRKKDLLKKPSKVLGELPTSDPS